MLKKILNYFLLYLIETIQQRKEYVTIAQHVQIFSMVSKYPYYQEKYQKLNHHSTQFEIINKYRYEYQQIRKAYI